MKSVLIVITGSLMFVFCSTLVQPEPTLFKARILNCTDEIVWCSSSCCSDTSIYARLVDSAGSLYDITTSIVNMSDTVIYTFTQDSFNRYFQTVDNGSQSSQCGPYHIDNGDTTEADSIVCITYEGPWPWRDPQPEGEGTWDCDESILSLHMRFVILTGWGGSRCVDSTLLLAYYFSDTGDTLYLANDGTYAGFVVRK
jgi:hypothetical protein